MTIRRDLTMLICGLSAGLVLAEVGPILNSRGTSSDITSLLAQQQGSTIFLRDLIHGTFFCIGPPKAMLVTTIELVFGAYKTENKADADDASIWTLAAIDPVAKTLFVYWINDNRIALEGVNSILCGQNLELRITRNEDEGLKQATVSNVEIRQLGGYSRVEGADLAPLPRAQVPQLEHRQ